MKPQDPSSQETQPKTLLPKKGRWAFVFFVAALVLTFLAGAWVQRNFSSVGSDSQPQQFLEVLSGPTAKDELSFSFQENREITWGPGLEEWFDGYPEASRIQRVVASYTVEYQLDPAGDWELREDVLSSGWTLFAPRPEFERLLFQSQDIQIEAEPALTPEEVDLARSFIAESMRVMLSQEEELRRDERWNALRERLINWVRARVSPPFFEDLQIEVIYSNDPMDRTDDL